eukprot:7567424-Pyramimonas_sp.AAC.1
MSAPRPYLQRRHDDVPPAPVLTRLWQAATARFNHQGAAQKNVSRKQGASQRSPPLVLGGWVDGSGSYLLPRPRRDDP